MYALKSVARTQRGNKHHFWPKTLFQLIITKTKDNIVGCVRGVIKSRTVSHCLRRNVY